MLQITNMVLEDNYYWNPVNFLLNFEITIEEILNEEL